MNIVAIVGSPRPAGNTNYLVDEALREAAGLGVETEKIILSQYTVGPCQGHDNCDSFDVCPQRDDAAWILEKFRLADGVILATPVYYYNMSAQMKAFVDRTYFLYRRGIGIQAKTAGIIVVAGSAGIEHTERALRRFLAFYVPSSCIRALSGLSRKVGEIRRQEAAVEAARQLGRDMAQELVQGPTKPRG